MYNDYYLKFVDEAAMLEVINNEGVNYPGCFIDVVGKVVDVPAVVDENGKVTAEATFILGYHVNVRIIGELPDALKPFEIPAPATPARVWA